MSGALSRPDELDDVFVSCGLTVQYFSQLPQDLVIPPRVAPLGQRSLAPWQDMLEASIGRSCRDGRPLHCWISLFVLDANFGSVTLKMHCL